MVKSFQLGFSKVKKIELKFNLRTYLLLNAIPILSPNNYSITNYLDEQQEPMQKYI